MAIEITTEADVDRALNYKTEPVEEHNYTHSLWPQPLGGAAYHGPAGDWLDLISPHTEADPPALLMQLLAGFGNLVGRGPHFRAEADRHYTILNVLIVGRTAKARKGTSEGRVRQILYEVDPDWAKRRIKTGLSTGEGLIYEVRDPQTEGKDPDPGESDKRLWVTEPEFARVLSMNERAGNSLSPTIRQAWDCPRVLSPMTKTNRCAATDPHITITGHITRDELCRMMSDTAASNGFGNRFLYVCSTRSKPLPDGGLEVDLSDIVYSLHAAVRHARTVGEMTRDDRAREIWRDIYPELSEGKPGLLGSVTSRAESQVMRIACLYALLDCHARIEEVHLGAALAVWDYCLASARYIFGEALGDQVADEILRALRISANGLTRTQIREHFGRNKPSTEISRALSVLAEYGLARYAREQTEGRPVEIWTAKTR